MSDDKKTTILDECRQTWKYKVTGEPATTTPLTMETKGEKKLHPESGGYADL